MTEPVALLDHRVVPHGSTEHGQKQRDLRCVDCGAVMLYYRAFPDTCDKGEPRREVRPVLVGDDGQRIPIDQPVPEGTYRLSFEGEPGEVMEYDGKKWVPAEADDGRC